MDENLIEQSQTEEMPVSPPEEGVTENSVPAGSRLPIALDITVPVSNTVPINLTVPVDIPLEKTELHEPFTGLQNVLAPYQGLLTSFPDSWEETRLCGLMGEKLCALIFGTR
jgi:hypothetical protein